MLSLTVFFIALMPTSHPSLDDLNCTDPGTLFIVNDQGLGCQGKELGIEFVCKGDKVLVWACTDDFEGE